MWEDVSTKLENQTKTTVSFLRSAALIWDMHFERITALRITVLKELDYVIEMNNKNSEVPTRSSFNVSKMKKCLCR